MEEITTPTLAFCHWWEGQVEPPLVFAEEDLGDHLCTAPRPLLEWVHVLSGSFTLKVGALGMTVGEGEVAWINAHGGNHADLAGSRARYACVSVDVSAWRAPAPWRTGPWLQVMRPPSVAWTRESYRNLVRLHRSPPSSLRQALLRAEGVRFVGNLLPVSSPEAVGGGASALVAAALDAIEAGHEDPWFRVQALAPALGVSASVLLRAFRAQVGRSPKSHLVRLRLQRAYDLLGRSDLSVKEIASRVGYRDPLHFSREFRALFGLPPSGRRGRWGNPLPEPTP